VKSVLAKGQIVIPKINRDLLNINIWDKMNSDIQNDKIIISKQETAQHVFQKMSQKHAKKLTMAEIKKELNRRHQED
jgi:bifunctional DNA-binding transcriptional regulator/antitoxin component of YhaV-PrlF toxin-antitoxin module